MNCIENFFWPETLPVWEDKTVELSNSNVFPLLQDEGGLDSQEILAFMHRGMGRFKLLDGFSLETHFSVTAKDNDDGSKPRFIRTVAPGGSTQYCGTVFINQDGSIRYRKTSKSPDSPYLHNLLSRFFAVVARGRNPGMDFIPC